jgi:hypothetical protein
MINHILNKYGFSFYTHCVVYMGKLRGASKIKLKNVNKKRMEFLKASIADLITLLFSSLQNSEGGGDSGNCFADPCQFLPFSKTKI